MLDQEPPSEGKAGDWYTWHNTLCQREHVRLEPASHRGFKPRVPFKKQKVQNETVRIDVYYFDPIANRRRSSAGSSRFPCSSCFSMSQKASRSYGGMTRRISAMLPGARG